MLKKLSVTEAEVACGGEGVDCVKAVAYGVVTVGAAGTTIAAPNIYSAAGTVAAGAETYVNGKACIDGISSNNYPPLRGSQVAGSIDSYNTVHGAPSLYDTGRNFSRIYAEYGNN